MGPRSGIDLAHLLALCINPMPRFIVAHGLTVHGIVPRIAVLLAVDDHHRLTVDVLLVFRHTELAHQRVDAVLARPDPRATAIDPRPVAENLGVGAPADPIAGLQQRHRATGLFEPQGGRQTGESRTDNAIIDICHG